MRSLGILIPLLTFLAVATFSLGCSPSGDAHAKFTQFDVEQVADLLATKSATAVDANSASTREEYGVIPGAVLLSTYGEYDVAKELPADKAEQLVFYCSSEKCSAAPRAASKAVDAGYSNVAVLPSGIKGWKAAGRETAEFQS